MNIDHLREFSFLADSLNFSATARHFFLSQSVLSKHIAAMEDELHTKLFERSSHKVYLTEQGQVFKEDADCIVARYEHAVKQLKSLEEGYAAALDVYYLRGASRPFLRKFLREMKKQAPGIRLYLHCVEFWEAQHVLNTRKADIVFTMDFCTEAHEYYRVTPLYTDCFHAIMNHDHPLHERTVDGKLPINALENAWLMLPDKTAYSDMATFIYDLLPKGQAHKRVDYYTDIDTAMLEIQSSAAVGFSSGHNKAFFCDDVDFIALSDVDASYQVSAFISPECETSELDKCVEIIGQLSKNGILITH